MILITLGTQDKKFYRLLDEVQRLIDKGVVKDKVVVQAGCSKNYKTNDMELFDLIPMDEFNKLIKKCDLLITHGGVGSIIDGLKAGKVVIAAPRLKKYKEHTNDHQLQIINNFSKAGYILGLTNFSDLESLIKKSKTFKPKKYVSNTKKMIKLVEKFIDN